MEAVFLRILSMSLSAAVVILVVLLARLALYRAPKKWSYGLWAVAGFRLCCPVSLKTAFSVFRLAPVSGAVTQAAEGAALPALPAAPAAAPVMETVAPAAVQGAAALPGVTQAAAASAAQAADPLAIWLWAGLLLWCAGMAAMLVYGVVSALRMKRLLADAVRAEGNVYESDRIRSPFILGLLRPRIYLPLGLEGDARSYVLAHEHFHLRRRDHLVKLLAFLLLTVHWFNPLCWLAFCLMSRDMEMSCDEQVLSLFGGVRAYSLSLLSLAAGRRFPSPSPLAFGEAGVKSRIRNVLRWKKPKTWVTLLAVALLAIVIAACGTNPAATAPPETEEPQTVRELTAEEIDRANQAFLPMTITDGVYSVSEISCFFTSSYDTMAELELESFLRYFPHSETLTDDDQAEFEALRALEGFPFPGGARPSELPVPIHRIREEDIDRVLDQYAGVGLKDLRNKDGVLYLAAYRAYYNFTSDAGAGTFQCVGGQAEGSTVRLWSAPETLSGVSDLLTLEEREGGYYIVSFRRTNWPEGADSPPAASPWQWTSTVTPAAIKGCDLSTPEGYRELTETEIDRLAELLNAVPEEAVYSGRGIPSDRVVDVTTGVGYRLRFGGDVIELDFDDTVSAQALYGPWVWEIHDRALYDFLDGLDPAAPAGAILTVASGGVAVEPYAAFQWAETWSEYGWIAADAAPVEETIREHRAELPVLTLAGGLTLTPGEGVSLSEMPLTVLDASLERVIFRQSPDAAETLAPGTYYGILHAVQQGRYIEAEKKWEQTGLSCIFVLQVPEPGGLTIGAIGQPMAVDLDGDGRAETLRLTYTPQPLYSSFYPPRALQLTIDAADFTAALYDERVIMGSDWGANPETELFVICDLDASDGYRELALMDYGPSDDYTTAFFRYEDGALRYLGAVEGLIYNIFTEKPGFALDGAGSVTSTLRLGVLQTWWAEAVWRLGESGELERVPQEVYYATPQTYYNFDTGEIQTARPLRKALLAYAEPRADAETHVLEAGTEITLLGTDNVGWVLAETGGEQFWIRLDERRKTFVETPEGMVYAGEVIPYLNYAD